MGKTGQVTCWQAGEGEETKGQGWEWASPKIAQPETMQLHVEVGLVLQLGDSTVQGRRRA